MPFIITSELKEIFASVSKTLSEACQLALKQTILGKQLVLMTDVSFSSAGYALMCGDSPDKKIQSKRKTYAPMAFGGAAQIFSPLRNSKFPYTQKNVLQFTWNFPRLHIFCGKQQSQQLF